ncbi:MAG: uridine kinase [Hyphomonadaceae bacterium]|nr:uridine kinase [Hyphomonadaceae bacterium]
MSRMHAATTPFLLALSGGSGSGKSTLADALIERFGSVRAVLIGEDAYYRPMSDYGDTDTAEARAAIIESIDYDSPEAKQASLLRSDLTALKSGNSVNAPIYDYARHDRSDKTQHIAPADILVLEGIHALSIPEITPLIDLSVYVDTPDDLRLARRLRRDVLERGRTVESVLSQYLSTVRPSHYRYTFPTKFQADLVIADEGLPAYGHVRPTPAAIERMLAPVLERLAHAGIAP